jgi:flagellar protein FlaG
MVLSGINSVKADLKLPEPAVIKKNNAEEKNQVTSEAAVNKNEVFSKSELDMAVDSANEIGRMLKRKLNFSIDSGTEKVVVKVIDEESGEVVRQVPPQEMLRIAAHLKRLREMNDQVMSAVKSVILDLRY